MKKPFPFLSRCWTVGLLLLVSCSKQVEQEAPVPASAIQGTVIRQPVQAEYIRRIKQELADRQYDRQLVLQLVDNAKSKITWTPLWEQATQNLASDGVSYLYVPLVPRIEVPPYVVKLTGMKRYLLVKRSNQELDFCLATYHCAEAQTSEKDSSAIPSATFTGSLTIKHLATGKGALFNYTNGVTSTPQTRKSSSNAANAVTCVTITTCYYSAPCTAAGGTPGGGGYYTEGSVTVSPYFCQPPTYAPCRFGSSGGEMGAGAWQNVGSEEMMQCTDETPPPSGPTPPGDPTPPGGGTGTVSTAATFDANIDGQALQPCMATILAQIKNLSNGQIGFIIQGFSGQIPGYNWTLQNGSLPVNTYGSTSSTLVNRAVVTTFDASQFANASDLSVARTIMHESVHAYLVASFENDRVLAQAAYSDLVQAWLARKHPNLNALQHDQMVRTFVQEIAYGLQQYGQLKGYNLPNDFYINMAWGGLEGTRAFRGLNLTQQQQIRNTILGELTGQDSSGNSITKKGNPSGC